MECASQCSFIRNIYRSCSNGRNGSPDKENHMLLHDSEVCHVTDLALALLSIEKVDEDLQPAYISDGQLTCFLRQVEVSQGAQRDDGCSLIASLQHINKFKLCHSSDRVSCFFLLYQIEK